MRKMRGTKPLVSASADMKLLRRVHGKKMPRLRQLGHMPKVLTVKERRLINISLVLLMVGLVWSSSTVLGKYKTEVPKVGGKYIEAVVGSPQLINPIFSSINDVDRDITRLVFSGLMKYDKKQQLVTDLAESFQLSDDKKTYTFKLKPEVVWHDGTSFTARDVVFTINTIQDSLVGSPLFVSFQGVTVSAVDDLTVQFVLKEAFSPFLASLTVGILPEHVWFDIAPERIRLHNQNFQPVGTGLFTFKKLTKDSTGFVFSYDLARFDKYYGEKSYLEELTFQFFGDYEGSSGAIQALRGQRVDGLSFVPHDLREKVDRKNINLYTLQLPQYTGIFFNQDVQKSLKDVGVRKALSLVIDKNRILREALRGEGQVINSPILPGFPGYSAELLTNNQDIAKANELLDKNWPRITAEEFRNKRREQLIKVKEEPKPVETETQVDSENVVSEEVSQVTTTARLELEQEVEIELNKEINDAQIFYRQNKDGEFLTLNLVTANTQEYKQTAALLAGFWQEIGVKTNIEFVEPKDVSRTVLKTRNYDMLLYGMILGSDPDQYSFWHSSQVDFPGLNLARYINRSVDSILEKIREISNEEEEIVLYKKFQDTILEEIPAIFLYMPTYTYAMDSNIKGIDVNRIFNPSDRFANVNEWYINTKGKWNFKSF